MYLNGVNRIHTSEGVQGVHRARTGRPNTTTSAQQGYPSDKVEISDVARYTIQAKSLPDIRADRVADAKAKIASGYYDSPDVLAATVERLFGEIG